LLLCFIFASSSVLFHLLFLPFTMLFPLKTPKRKKRCFVLPCSLCLLQSSHQSKDVISKQLLEQDHKHHKQNNQTNQTKNTSGALSRLDLLGNLLQALPRLPHLAPSAIQRSIQVLQQLGLALQLFPDGQPKLLLPG